MAIDIANKHAAYKVCRQPCCVSCNLRQAGSDFKFTGRFIHREGISDEDSGQQEAITF